MTEYVFAGKRVRYLEYGAGAEIVQCGGGVIANFPNHLDAEAFVDLLPQVPEGTAAATLVTFALNPARRNAGAQLAIIGQHIVSMGEGHADIDMEKCPVHGEQPHIGGYNQGGWDNMAVCLKCCAVIYAAWLAKRVTPEQKAGE